MHRCSPEPRPLTYRLVMAASTTRWLCLVLSLLLLQLLQGPGVGCQLRLGGADSFIPLHLDAAATAVATTGKTLEVTPLADASGTNAAVTAAAEAAVAAADATETPSDPDSPGASQADDSLISTATDSPTEETTLPDFDDYTADETETTRETSSSPENDISHTGEADHSSSSADSKQGPVETTDVPSLTRRIVFAGPDSTVATSQPPEQSTRPSSVVRGLDVPHTDSWLPNWPTQLLGSSEEPTRELSLRFPSESPTAVPDTAATSLTTLTPSNTVSKIPVTQYYFDLTSVSSTAIPGPLFDREDLGVSVPALHSALPDLTQPLELEDLPSSISDLQSSVLVDAAGPPVTSTPALPHSVTSAVVDSKGPQSISVYVTTQTLPPPSSALNEVVGGHTEDNTLVEEAENQGDATINENTESPEVLPTGTGSTQIGLEDRHPENTTASEDPGGLQSPTHTDEAPRPTSEPQPAAPSLTGPAPASDSEPLTTTSSTTPGSVKPSPVRTSQAAKTSRIPLWQLLSQSSPSRPVNTQLPSTPLTPSVAATLSADSVTPLTTAPPPSLSTSIEPLALDESPASTLTPSLPDFKSAPESTVPDDSAPFGPLDNNDPDQILTKTMKSEPENVTLDSTSVPESTEPLLVESPELVTDDELQSNTTSQGSIVDTNFSLSVDPHTPVDNDSTADVVDNALDGIHPNIISGNNTPENRTEHENTLPDDPKVVENDPLLTSDREANDSVFDPAEVLVTSSPTVSAMWTPVIDVTESHTEDVSVPVSPSSVLTSTTVISPAPPEVLGGFSPVISSIHTTPVSHSEVLGGIHTIPSSTSAAAPPVDSTTTASAPAQDLSTPPAPTPTLIASLEPTAVQKTDTTDDPIPTLLPQPVQPEHGDEEGTREEVPQKESAPEEVTLAPPPPLLTAPAPSPPPPDPATPMTIITTTTTTSTTTTTEAATTPAAQPTTVTSDTTTAFTPPMSPPSWNTTAALPGVAPSLTTTMVLQNGTTVVVELPYIRALVDYNAWEFCQLKHDFRSMFAEWITRHLNGSVQVAPSDIKFFSMTECPNTPPSRDDLSAGKENGENLGALPQEEENHTQVYFYVTRAGEADPGLTEKFPLFPTDLVISEKLTYLLPRVRQLEVVRPDESSNQDQLQETTVGTSVIVIIVICSIVGVTIIVILFFFMVVKRRGAANNYYGRRCTPVSMDAYSMDSVSVYHSFRRKSKRRASGRSMKSYLNQAFDDPNGPSRALNFAKLTHFISDIDGVHEEFATIPVNMPKYDELPPGVEDKNRYANVIPVPETRVLLKVTKDGRNCEYINANFVRGARNESKYYIATQAPLDDTVADFWRMIWEQETRVVVMLTDFVEKGIDKCADYLPPSETLDCHRLYGDFQITLKSRDMREKFVVSNVQLKNLENNLVREVAHMWYTGWPASGVPNEEAAFISFILEVRRTRKKLRAKGPIVVHCSPGTGRSGTFVASDMVMKQFEEHRTIDVPRTVYAIRRDRAGAVQTKEQYAFIYRVINLYASKLTSGNLESL